MWSDSGTRAIRVGLSAAGRGRSHDMIDVPFRRTSTAALSDVSTPIEPARSARPSSASGAGQDARIHRFGAPVVETVPLLRLAVAAARELAALDEALARSPAGPAAAAAFAVLDAAAALAFDGQPVDVRGALGDRDGREAALVRARIEACGRARRQLGDSDLDQATLVAFAGELCGTPVNLRDREPSVHERASLAPGQRLLRGRDRVGQGLDAWMSFLVRGAGEAEPLLVVGEAYRRLLALRPFTRGNLGLAQAVTALLLELEGRTGRWTLPLAHRLLARSLRHAELLAAGEGEPTPWLVFWLEQVRACAERSRGCLAVLERHRAEVQEVADGAVRGPLPAAALDVLAGPGFTTAALTGEGELTRHAARLVLDAMEEATLVRSVGAGRARHYVGPRVLDALSSE